MARSMMMGLNQKKSARFWAEAIKFANYLRNRLYSLICKQGTTLSEEIHGKPPDLTHARTFGCRALVHVTEAKQTDKFCPRAECGILVEYDRGNAYRLFYPSSQKVVISKVVDFVECDQATQTSNGKNRPVCIDAQDFNELGTYEIDTDIRAPVVSEGDRQEPSWKNIEQRNPSSRNE